MPGVLGVFTGADCLADGLGPIPHTPVPATRYDMKLTGPGGGNVFVGPHLLLPADKVRHVGEAVAMVVAETASQALDAAEAVEVEYEELPWSPPPRSARARCAGALGRGAGQCPGRHDVRRRARNRSRLRRRRPCGQDGIQHRPRHRRPDGAALRARRITMPQTDRYTLYAGSGGAVRQKQELAAVLGIEPDRLRVLSYDVGGNFGSRNRPYVEFGLVLWAARKLGRPVKYTATRSEAFLSDYQGRDLVTKVELALSIGRPLPRHARRQHQQRRRALRLALAARQGLGLITGSYNIPAATLRARAVFTNTMPTNAYRSSGRPEVTFAIERLIDIAAARLGIDRIALRRRNLVRPEAMPYTNAVGMTYDSGTYEANMDLAMRIADWDGFKARRREAEEARQAARPAALRTTSSPRSARRRSAPRSPCGRRVASTSSSARSRAARATRPASRRWPPICSACRSPAVNIIIGDTDIVSVGGGSHSGRSMRHAATVMSKAPRADRQGQGDRRPSARC